MKACGGGTLLAGRKSAVERFDRLLLLRVEVEGESRERLEAACERRETGVRAARAGGREGGAGELTSARMRDLLEGSSDSLRLAAAAPLRIESSVMLSFSQYCDSMG